MGVKFSLENKKKNPTSVAVIVWYNGKRFKLSAGISVQTDKWDDKTNRVSEKDYPDGEFINIELNRANRDISALFDDYKLKRITPTAEQVKNDFKSLRESGETGNNTRSTNLFFIDYFKDFIENSGYAYGTKKRYNTIVGWLLKYEKKTGKRLSFDDINLQFYERFRNYVLSQKYRPKKDMDLHNYSLNFVGSLVAGIKHVMRETGPEGLAPIHDNTDYKHFKKEGETADTIYMTVDELLKLHRWNATPDNLGEFVDDKRLEIRMRAVNAFNLSKNKFLIGAFTALRVSDFNRLREVNVKENVIRIKPKKGIRKNEDVVIPIHPVVREILESGFDIATPISDQKINKNIKKVCKLVGITEKVVVSRTEGGKLVEREFEKWQLVTTHTARRSGATNMYLAGIPSISIMKITGHRTENSFLKYIKISQEENAVLLAGHAFFKG